MTTMFHASQIDNRNGCTLSFDDENYTTHILSPLIPSEKRPEMFDTYTLSGIAELSFDSPFLYPVFLLSPPALFVLSFVC